MEKLQKGLSEVDRKVEALKKKFEKTTTEAAKLRVELEKAEETITAAENLVGKLEGEYNRWSAQVSGVQFTLTTLKYFCKNHGDQRVLPPAHEVRVLSSPSVRPCFISGRYF